MGQYQQGPPQGYAPQPQPVQPRQPVPFDFQSLIARFTTGELVIGGATILFLIFSFFTGWIKGSFSCGSLPALECNSALINTGGGISLYNGWGWLALVAMLAVIVFFVLRKFLSAVVPLPALPVPDAYVYMGLGAVEVLGILLMWIEYHASTDFGNGASASVTFGWTWFLGMILAIAVIVGGYLTMQDPAPAVAGTGAIGGGYGQQPGYGQPGYGQPPTAYPPQPYAAPQAPPYAAPPAQPGYGTPPAAPSPYPPPVDPQQSPPPGYPPQQ